MIAVCGVIACNATAPASRSPAVTLTPPTPAAVPRPVATSDGPKLFSELPPVDSERVVGFSKDDIYLGYSISTCDPCPSEFHFESPTKLPLDFSYHYDPEHDDGSAEAEARAKKQDEMVERRLKELGAVHAKDGRTLRGPFPYPDLTFATKSTRDETKGTVAVLFGARADGEEPVYPIRVELGPQPMWDVAAGELAPLSPAERKKLIDEHHEQFRIGDAVLEYANVTRDGSDVGVVAVAGGTMWWETAAVARMSSTTFVAHVYDETGMHHLRSKDFARALALFQRAAAVRNDATIAHHTACVAAHDPACR